MTLKEYIEKKETELKEVEKVPELLRNGLSTINDKLDEMNKKVKFKINLFHLLDDLGGWEYFDQIVEDKMDNEYMSEGGYTLLSPLDKDELEWECEVEKEEMDND